MAEIGKDAGESFRKERVCLSACGTYDYMLLKEKIHDILDALGANDVLPARCRAVIKPNLLFRASPDTAIATHPLVVAAVAAELKERGAGSVMVAESPSGPYTQGSLRRIYDGCGYLEMSEKYGVELNMDCSHSTLPAPDGLRCREFQVIQPLLDADVIINIAKMKTHCMMGMSGAVKNLFGAVPGLMKPELHCRFPEKKAFGEMIADLCLALKPAISLIDGVLGMEGNGPGGGKPRQMGMLVASRNPFAADFLCAELMSMKQESLEIMKTGMERGVSPQSMKEIEIWGGKPEEFRMEGFLQPESKSVDFIHKLPGFLRPIATKLATPVPKVRMPECVGCGKCAEICPQHTIRIQDGKALIFYDKCIRCYCCHEVCPKHVIDIKRLGLFRF